MEREKKERVKTIKSGQVRNDITNATKERGKGGGWQRESEQTQVSLKIFSCIILAIYRLMFSQ